MVGSEPCGPPDKGPRARALQPEREGNSALLGPGLPAEVKRQPDGSRARATTSGLGDAGLTGASFLSLGNVL